MCAGCDEEVATVGQALDGVIRAECEARQVFSNCTIPEHTVRLAAITLETYSEAPDKSCAVAHMALSLAVAVSRLIAAQDVYGITL